jgi:hypothetical protein
MPIPSESGGGTIGAGGELTQKGLAELYVAAQLAGPEALFKFLNSLNDKQFNLLTGSAEWQDSQPKQTKSSSVWDNQTADSFLDSLKRISGGRGGGGYPRQDVTTGDIKRGLHAAGFYDLGFDVSDFIKEGARKDKDVGWVIDKIVSDKRFTRSRPGILDSNGVLVVAPAQYDQYRTQYREVAAQYGLSVSSKQVGSLIRGDVSAAEFEFRAKATNTIRGNSQAFSAFNEVLKDRGQEPLKSTKDVFDFVTGKKSKEMYDLYEETAFETAARSSGLSVSDARRNQLANRTAGVSSFEDVEQRYARIASELRTAGVELKTFGISQNALETIEFGGPNRAKLAASAEQALKQRQAALEGQLAQQKSGTSAQGRPVIASSLEAGY